MFTVYILKNKNNKLYIGQTENLAARLESHNVCGQGYTAKYRPWDLIYQEKFLTRQESMARERYLKTGAGRDWIKKNILHA